MPMDRPVLKAADPFETAFCEKEPKIWQKVSNVTEPIKHILYYNDEQLQSCVLSVWELLLEWRFS